MEQNQSNELAIVEGVFSESQVDLIRRTLFHKDATDAEMQLFFYQAARTGLDPLSRQITPIFRWNNREKRYVMTVQTNIDGYRLIADRTGKYAGSDDPVYDEGLTQYQHLREARGKPQTATVTVWKLVGGVRCPFTATAEWSAYTPSDDKAAFMWNKMPYLMLGKCAEALALRKAFPAELSGLYTDEEMNQAGEVVDVKTVEITTSGEKKPIDSKTSPPPPQVNERLSVGRPYSPEEVKERLDEAKEYYLGDEATEQARNRLAAALESAFQEDEDELRKAKRYTVTNWLTGKNSTKELSHEIALAMMKWTGIMGNSLYVASADAKKEIELIYEQALKEDR